MWLYPIIGLLILALCTGPGVAFAACTNPAANAKAQEFAAIMKQKMATKPDEMGDLASEFGDVMTAASSGVTERTCTQLDALVKRAKAL